MADTYENFTDLAANEAEGIDYRITVVDRGSAIAVLAPHGGKIEPMSSEIAMAIAGTDLSLYLFEGSSGRDNARLHITSTRFDEPKALRLVAASATAIAVHGRTDRDDPDAVWLGGRASLLRNAAAAALAEADFPARTEGHDLPGMDQSNICNRCRCGAGLQLEIPRSMRDRLAQDQKRLRAFAAAIRSAAAPSC